MSESKTTYEDKKLTKALFKIKLGWITSIFIILLLLSYIPIKIFLKWELPYNLNMMIVSAAIITGLTVGLYLKSRVCALTLFLLELFNVLDILLRWNSLSWVHAMITFSFSLLFTIIYLSAFSATLVYHNIPLSQVPPEHSEKTHYPFKTHIAAILLFILSYAGLIYYGYLEKGYFKLPAFGVWPHLIFLIQLSLIGSIFIALLLTLVFWGIKRNSFKKSFFKASGFLYRLLSIAFIFIVFIESVFIISHIYHRGTPVFKCQFVDENNNPLTHVFVDVYPVIELNENQPDIQSYNIDKTEYAFLRKIVSTTNESQLFPYDDTFKNYQVENCIQEIDRWYEISHLFAYHYFIKQDHAQTFLYSLNTHYSFNLKSSSKQTEPNPLPVKYYIIFKKIGYSYTGVFVDPDQKTSEIKTIKLTKLSENPHLKQIHQQIETYIKSFNYFSPAPKAKQLQALSALETEMQYAKNNGFVDDARDLYQYTLYEKLTHSFSKTKDKYDIVREWLFSYHLLLEELNKESIDRIIINQLYIEAKWIAMLKQEDLSLLIKNEIIQPIEYTDFKWRYLEATIQYLDFLDTQKMKLVLDINPDVYDFIYIDFSKEIKSIPELSDRMPELNRIRKQLNQIAYKAIQINPFEKSYWNLYERTLEKPDQ